MKKLSKEEIKRKEEQFKKDIKEFCKELIKKQKIIKNK